MSDEADVRPAPETFDPLADALDEWPPRRATQPGAGAAFFDLDRTLISGSSAFVFGVTAWRHKLVDNAQFAADAWAAIKFKALGDTGGDVASQVRERILGAVKGVAVEDLVKLNETIVPKLLERVRPESRELLDVHHHAGRSTYIVSASPIELVEPLAKALGMTAGIGTVSAIQNGRYTGELAGPFCYGDGKVEAIAELARWERFDLAQCYAYSDSVSDLPMMQAVGHPVAVNPDSHLQRIAERKGWPIVIFARRTKAVVRRVTAGAAGTAIAAGSFTAGWKAARARFG